MRIPFFGNRTHAPVVPAPAAPARPTDFANFTEYCKAQLDAVEGFTPPPHILEQMHERASESNAIRQAPDNWVQFGQFCRVMLDTLRQLHQNSGLGGGFEHSEWCRLAERLGLLNGPGNLQPLGIDLGTFYTSTCTDLQKMAKAFALMQQYPQHFTQDYRDRAETHIRELSNKLNVCGPGTSQNIESALKNIMLVVCPPDFPGRFAAKRLEIAKQIFVEFAAKHLSHEFNPIGTEIHMVTALQNYYAIRFDLPIVDDRYANSSYAQLEPQARKELEQKLECYLHPEHIATELAQEFMQRLEASQANPAGQTTPNSPDFPSLCRELEKQKPILGKVHPSWVCDVDADTGAVKWKTNITLLAVHALEESRKQSDIEQDGSQQATLPDPRSFAWGKQTTLHLGKKLIWCEEKIGAHNQLVEAGLDALDSDVLQRWTKADPGDPNAMAVIVECLRNNPSPPFENFNEIATSELNPEMKLAICWSGLRALPEPTPQVQALIQNLEKHITPLALTLLLTCKHADKLSEQTIQACLEYPEVIHDETLDGLPTAPLTIAEAVLGLDPSLNKPEIDACAKVFERALKIVLQSPMPLRNEVRICNAAMQAGVQHLEHLKKQTDWLSPRYMLRHVSNKPEFLSGATKPVIFWVLNELSQSTLQRKLPCSALLDLIKNPNLSQEDILHIGNTLASKGLMEPILESDVDTFVHQTLASGSTSLAEKLFPQLPRPTLARELTRIVNTEPELLYLNKHRSTDTCEFLEVLQRSGMNFDSAGAEFLKEIMRSQTPMVLSYALMFLRVDPNRVAHDEPSPLIYAIEMGSCNEARQLIKHGANPFAAYNGATALDRVLDKAQNSHPMFTVAVDMMQKIHGITQLDQQGYTPLHHAVLAANQHAALLQSPHTNTPENQRQFELTLTKLKVTAAATYATDMRSSWAHWGKTALHLAHLGGNARVIEAVEAGGANNRIRDYRLRLPGQLNPRG